MIKGIIEGKKETGIQFSELDKVYSPGEVAQLFSCLSPEIQDELISVMREMVEKNKASQYQEQIYIPNIEN